MPGSHSIAEGVALARWPRWSLRMRPSLLVIGAQKCGTTSLFEYLAGHPNVRAPRAKELQHFTKRWERGASAYARKFPLSWSGDRASMTFESSPAYLFFPPAPERARGMLPGARLIAMLRDPGERAFSHWRHECRAGNETLGFEEALDAEARRTAGEYEAWRRDPTHDLSAYWRFSYTARGMYSRQLDRWVSAFGRDALLVLRAEDLFERPATVLDGVLEFLGLRPWRPPAFEAFNASGSRQEMEKQTRERLREVFRGANADLRARYGEELCWDD